MGLDQYLYEEKYLGHWEFNKGEPDYVMAEKVLDITGLQHDPGSGGVTVKVCAIYWRKANQIHNWIRTNCHEMTPDVRYEVGREDLETLRDTCKEVLASSELVTAKVVNGQRLTDTGWQDNLIINPQRAIDLLPTTDGFFFGSTEYDQWYIKDLEFTIEAIDALLERTEETWFEYYASW